MRPCECSATDEVDPIAELAAQESQQVRDEVISLDLFYGGTELSGYRVDFVSDS